MTKVWQVGRWMEPNKLHVCLAYKSPWAVFHVLHLFLSAEELVELCGPQAMVGSLEQRYLGSWTTADLTPMPTLTGLEQKWESLEG